MEVLFDPSDDDDETPKKKAPFPHPQRTHLPRNLSLLLAPETFFLCLPPHLTLSISYLCACLISLTKLKEQEGYTSKKSLSINLDSTE